MEVIQTVEVDFREMLVRQKLYWNQEAGLVLGTFLQCSCITCPWK